MDASGYFLYPLDETLETGARRLSGFAAATSKLHKSGIRFAFGGTPPIAEHVSKLIF